MNWKQALALGLRSVGSYAEQKATMYSYNGTVLPKLPEWEGYSHKVLYNTGSIFWVRAYANKPTTVKGYSVAPYVEYDRLVADGEWHSAFLNDDAEPFWYYTNETSNDQKGASLDITDIVWANVDILTSDNVLHLAASDPIPVYA